MEFSDQTKLIYGIEIIRDLLDSPSKLSSAELKVYRRLVQRLSEACQFNAGWHMASPDKELRGPAATERLFADIHSVTEVLHLNAKPKKRTTTGRPKGSVRPLEKCYRPVIEEYLKGKKTLSRCVTDALRNKILDTDIHHTAHLRRIERHQQKKIREATEWARKSGAIFTPAPSEEFCAKCGLNKVLHPSKSHGGHIACDSFVPSGRKVVADSAPRKLTKTG
jgi:hypothetical protein